jgi:hypothetical protein
LRSSVIYGQRAEKVNALKLPADPPKVESKKPASADSTRRSMKGLKPFLSLLLGCWLCAILSGCAGKTPANGPGALNIAQFSLQAGVPGVPYRQLLIASGGVEPYTWSISVGSLPPGLSLTSDGIISGTPTTVGTSSFTVQVIDSQTPTKAVDTAPMSIMINPVLSMTGSTLDPGTVGSLYSATLSASNGVPPYTYTVASGSLPPGLTLTTNATPQGGGPNSATIGTTSGTSGMNESPTQAGVFNFVIQATDALGEVATGTYNITVVGRLQGNYTITFNGFDNGQPFYMVGSIVTDGNGNVTSGVLDVNGPQGISSAVPVTGTYNLPNNSNIGTATLTAGSETYKFSVLVAAAGDSNLIMTDPNNPQRYGSGLLKQQATFSLPANVSSYAFGFYGNDTSGSRYAGAGVFAVNSQLSVTGGQEDTNDNGSINGGGGAGTPLTIAGGTVTTPNITTGRGTFTLNVSGQGTANYVYYTTGLQSGADGLVAMETDSSGPMTLLSLFPQAAGGINQVFANNSLTCSGTGACVVLQLNGLSASGPDAQIGVATFDGNGNITRSGIDGLPGYFTDESNAGTASQNRYDGTYSVANNGRVTVNLTGATYQPIWYLVTKNQAFIVGTDPLVTSGQLNPQSGAPFTLASLLGSYLGGTIAPVSSNVTNEIDVSSTPPPGGIWFVTYESNGPNGIVPASGQMPPTFTGTYTIDATYGAAFGRFEIMTNAGQLVSVLYIAGSGSAGATGNKTGLLGVNLGSYTNGTPDPNPRITLYGR